MCPECNRPDELEPLDPRFAAELGGLTTTYLLCQSCKTISREVRKLERILGTLVLVPMLGVSLLGGAAGCYLWIALLMRGKPPLGFVLASFILINGAAFAIATIFKRLSILHSTQQIIPIGELRPH